MQHRRVVKHITGEMGHLTKSVYEVLRKPNVMKNKSLTMLSKRIHRLVKEYSKSWQVCETVDRTGYHFRLVVNS